MALSARAKMEGAHFLADDSICIADEELPDDPELARVEVQHRKLKIDTRLRLIGKWNSKAYGDKIETEHTGGQTFTVVTGVPRDS